MARTGFISFCAAFMLVSGSLCSAPAAESTPWQEIHSTHFTVITDAGEKKGREVALRFEQMRAVFNNLLTKDHLNQPVPLTILAFSNDKSYYQLAPLRQGQPIGVPGFLLTNDDQDFIALNLMETEPWRAVAGDLARLWLGDNYPPVQEWFDDGFVAYFSSIRVNDKNVEIGGDPSITGTFDQLPGGVHNSFTEALSSQEWIPLPDLFAMKHDPSRVRDNALGQDPHLTKYYAESWMVMHYLIHENKLPETGSYFDLVFTHQTPIEEAIQKAYGVTPAQLQDAVKQYFQSLTALRAEVEAARQKASSASSAQPYHYAVLVSPGDSTITAAPFPEPDARALYAEVQVRIPERRDLGLEALKKLATTPTASDIKAEAKNEQREKQEDKVSDNPLTLPTNAVGNALAHRVLAWDDIQRNQFDEALAELGDAAVVNPRDMWVRYYLCVLKYRMSEATHSDIRGLANMLIDLRSVLEWYPEMASAYDLLAVARNAGGSSPAAMQAERAAMSLSPRNQMFAYHLAQIYISAKKWEAAQALLERLKNTGNPEIEKLAQERLDEIGNERKYGLTASAADSHPQFAPQKTPFDVLDEDAAKRAAAEKQQQSGTADRRPTKFLKGRLIAVDCSSPPTAILTVSAEGALLKLRSSDYKSLLLIGADDFSCDWRNRPVTVNYKPGGLSDGDLVSVEVK
jgi:tetratricopeptide (TPR) repeat protein